MNATKTTQAETTKKIAHNPIAAVDSVRKNYDIMDFLKTEMKEAVTESRHGDIKTNYVMITPEPQRKVYRQLNEFYKN